MPPTVSVIMTVYNGETHIRASVDALLAQTLHDFELIVVDDGSTDRTPEILASYDDPRIRVVRNERNLGPYGSANRGIELARGEFIARNDADDVSLPERLERQVQAFRERPKAALVSTEYRMIDEHGDVVTRLGTSDRAAHPDVIAWNLMFYNHVGAHSQVMFRREDARAVGGYPLENRYSQDYAMWLLLSERGQVVVLPQVLLEYRMHERNITGSFRGEQVEHSLVVSRTALGRFLGREVSRREALDVRALFELRAGDVEDLRAAAGLLDEAYGRYVREREPSEAVRDEIRAFHSDRFSRCAPKFARRRRAGDVTLALREAFRWSPRTAWRRVPGSFRDEFVRRKSGRAGRRARRGARSAGTS
jgi:glycosyltransferase involved in cell wall biosynthesis